MGQGLDPLGHDRRVAAFLCGTLQGSKVRLTTYPGLVIRSRREKLRRS